MQTQSTNECHCKSCNALLAKRDRDGLTIRRGGMQVVVPGECTVTCYRDSCRAVNILSSREPTPTVLTAQTPGTITA